MNFYVITADPHQAVRTGAAIRLHGCSTASGGAPQQHGMRLNEVQTHEAPYGDPGTPATPTLSRPTRRLPASQTSAPAPVQARPPPRQLHPPPAHSLTLSTQHTCPACMARRCRVPAPQSLQPRPRVPHRVLQRALAEPMLLQLLPAMTRRRMGRPSDLQLWLCAARLRALRSGVASAGGHACAPAGGMGACMHA